MVSNSTRSTNASQSALNRSSKNVSAKRRLAPRSAANRARVPSAISNRPTRRSPSEAIFRRLMSWPPACPDSWGLQAKRARGLGSVSTDGRGVPTATPRVAIWRSHQKMSLVR